MNFRPFTSVTRWLLVVIGCAVLATAQPMSAADAVAPTVAPSASDAVIFPKGAAQNEAALPTKNSESSQGYVLVIALLLAGAGAWIMLQRRKGVPLVSRGPKKLQLEETRPLGNRQYLVVASYEGKKFLLGVTTGQIQMLTELEAGANEEASS